MKTGKMGRLVGVGLALGLLASAVGAVAAPTQGAVTTEQLIYQSAAVQVQVDVNGAAAVQLVGDALDALASTAKEQVGALAQAGPGGPAGGKAAVIAAALPLIDPAKEAIKSLTRAAFVVMKPSERTSGDAVSSYYNQLMAGQGWSPLITVKGPNGERISAMLAPEAKGIFLMVQEKTDLVVGMITTSQPIGQLIGQIVRAGGGVVPAIIAARAEQPAQALAEQSEPTQQEEPKQ